MSRNYREHKQGARPTSVPVQSVLAWLENPKSLNTCIHMCIFVHIHTYIHVRNLLGICKAFSSPRKSHSHTWIPRAPTSIAGAKLRFSNSLELESDLRTQIGQRRIQRSWSRRGAKNLLSLPSEIPYLIKAPPPYTAEKDRPSWRLLCVKPRDTVRARGKFSFLLLTAQPLCSHPKLLRQPARQLCNSLNLQSTVQLGIVHRKTKSFW